MNSLAGERRGAIFAGREVNFDRLPEGDEDVIEFGKSCIRFRNLEDLPRDVIGRVLAPVPLATSFGRYRNARTGKSGATGRVRKS